MSNILCLFVRTILASMLCVALFMVSGKVFNFLPAIIFLPVLAVYYQQAMLWYFVIASEDIVSTIIGILLSLLFIVLYIINFSAFGALFKAVDLLGLLFGVAQTIKSVKLRILGYA